MRAARASLWCVIPSVLFAAALAAQPADDAAQAKALIASGSAHEEAGRLDAAAKDYAAALAAAQRTTDRELQATASVMVGYLQYYRGDMDDALVNFQRAYDLAVALGDASGQATVLGYIATVYSDANVGQYERAIQYYEQVLAAHQAAGKPDRVADTLFNIASTWERKGDNAQALDWYQRALAAETALGRKAEVAFVQRSIGITLTKLGRPAEALPLFAAALGALEAAADHDRAMMVRQSRGIAYRQLGRLPQAIADLEATRRWFADNKSTRFLEKSEDELALAYAAAGRWQDAYAARTRHGALQKALAEKLREEHSARLRVKFDSERSEQENRALLREQAAAKRIRDLQTIALTLGGVVLAVLLFFSLRLRRDARRMRVMALTDELTRLPNRRHLLAVADELLDHSFAAREPLTLIAFDIDHFKRINDQHGHAAGDLVLQRVAHACRTALRPSDRLGRTGGEEFIAVLPNTDEAGGTKVAERLRAAVEELRFEGLSDALCVTISLGVAERTRSDTLSLLTARADARLYRAKDGGRNRVVPEPG